MDRQSSSSSKVTVEYHDPSGVFPLIAPGLGTRLPLRNLHWNSQSRPLRSINSLHVELVPDNDSLKPTTSRSDAPSDQTHRDPSTTVSRPESSGNGANKVDLGPGQQKALGPTKQTTVGAVKERRHQIPGLRQTPYLKIYLLRCDDSETYKASSRKLLREWIKAHTRPTQSTTAVNTQENHDAFEWLILHVVIPGTPAAAQSRWSAGGGGGNTADKVAGGSRFLGKSSSTIFEKISADFNGTGKTARDRTAQVRLRKDELPYSAQIQMPAPTTSYDDDQQERSDPWDDVLSKMKALILTSFDLRVTQYEEDIREKDSQRNLPGWNFCTFFVLKEGLARGFESVGLVEDALTGYDELALGLDTVVREQTSEGFGDHQGATFLDHTEELLQEAQLALLTAHHDATKGEKKSSENAEVDITSAFTQRPESWPLNAIKKNYRELILANNISIFDFQCYIFARQLCLLLRLGHGLSSDIGSQETLRSDNPYDQTGSAARGHLESRDSMRRGGDAGNLFALAEVCRRALEFITSVARTLRSDLFKGIECDSNDADNTDKQGIGDPKEIAILVENMASSWVFAVCQQIIHETVTSSIEHRLSSRRVHDSVGLDGSHTGNPNGLTTSSEIRPDSTTHPARTSSLPNTSAQAVGSSTLDSNNKTTYPYEVRRNSKQSSHMPPEVVKPGTEGLVSSRAELYLLARRTARHLGENCEGTLDYTGKSLFPGLQIESDLENVPLADIDTKQLQTGSPELASLAVAGIQCMPLRLALESRRVFYALYEFLTQESLAHFEAARRTKSVHQCTTDLAILKFHLEDYVTAASYFHRIAPFYAEGNWDLLEVSVLTFYARCLKKLGRNDDYVRVILKILGKNAAEAIACREADDALISSGQDPSDTVISSGRPPPFSPGTTEFGADLLSYGAELHREISVPMNRYMRNIKVNPYITNYDDKDGFQLRLSFRCMLGDRIPIQSARVKISSTDDGPLREIWLESDETLILRPGLIKFWLHSNANVHGVYSVTKILLRCQKINFVHDMRPQKDMIRPASVEEVSASSGAETGQVSQVFCYSRASALQAKLSLSSLIHLERSRSVEISIHSGWNNVLEGELRIRAASAGLRLRIAETVPVDDSMAIQENSHTGGIEFRNLPPRSSATLRIPYTSESDLNELSLKIEVSYRTDKGRFFYASNPSVSIVLSLGVNVQDNFKEHILISKFNVSTVTSVPLRMMSSKLEGSSTLDAKPASSLVTGCNISRRQPASLIYKITRRDNEQATSEERKAQTSLSLSIDYACMDEEIALLVEAKFLETIKESPFEDLSCLLLPVLLRRVRSKLAVAELERATLVQEIDLGPFEGILWPQTLVWLPPSIREQVYQWLRKWHEMNRVLSLADSFGPSTEARSNRRIIIPVEIPSVSVVHTVKLRIVPVDKDSQPSVALAAVGQIIAASLKIKHTRRWATTNFTDASPQGEEKPLHFSYEVQANSDSWLVAGRRKGHFWAKENETLTFPLALLPQRAGYLLYPTVEIRALSSRPGNTDRRPSSAGEGESKVLGEASSNDVPQLHCETDYRNQADVILVLPNLKSSTVSLDPVGPGGSASLVDSDRRVEATMS